MAEEPQDVVAADAETAPESSPADQQPEEPTSEPASEDEGKSEEPVDETGVPLKNRIAEAERKIRKAQKLSAQQAEAAIISGSTETTPPSQDEAVEIVRKLAREEATAVNSQQQQHIEKILVKQFFLENPDAMNPEIVDRINTIRNENPKLSSVEDLPLVYEMVQGQVLRDRLAKEAEAKARVKEERKAQATQAAVEGTGRVSSAPMPLDRAIKEVKSMDELRSLRPQIFKQ